MGIVCFSPPPPKAGRFDFSIRTYNGDVSEDEDDFEDFESK